MVGTHFRGWEQPSWIVYRSGVCITIQLNGPPTPPVRKLFYLGVCIEIGRRETSPNPASIFHGVVWRSASLNASICQSRRVKKLSALAMKGS